MSSAETLDLTLDRLRSYRLPPDGEPIPWPDPDESEREQLRQLQEAHERLMSREGR